MHNQSMAALFFILAVIGISTVTGAAMFKASDQRKKDSALVTYELTNFPHDLAPDRIVAFLTSISGAKAPRRQVKGIMTTTFELQAREGRIRVFMRMPEVLSRGIIRQLHGAIPGMVAAQCDEPFDYPITYATEVGLNNPSKEIYVRDIADMNTAILKSIDALGPDEIATIQLLVSPIYGRMPIDGAPSDVFRLSNAFSAPKKASSDELRARKAKLATTNFRGVLRIAAHAKSEVRAQQIASDIKRVYDATGAHGNDWRRNPRRLDSLITDIREARAPIVAANYVQVSTTELAALVGWQVNGAAISSLPSGGARPRPVSQSVLSKGIEFGIGNHPETARRVAVSVIESCKHWHIVGRTGSGKSALGSTLAAQHIFQGRGVAIFDPKGDESGIAERTLDLVPQTMIDKVIYFNAADVSRPLGLNLLDGSPQAVASNLQAIFSHIYKDAGAVRMPEVLYHLVMILKTTTAKGGPFTFLDILPLISSNKGDAQSARFAKAIFDGVKDPYLKGWIADKQRMSATERDKYYQPLRSRIWQFAARPEIRNIIGQSKSSIDFDDIVQNKKLLIVNFNGMPKDVTELMGSVMMMRLMDVMKKGWASEEEPFALFADEFQYFVHSATPFKDMLAEMRSRGLAMHLLHQGLDQFDGRRDLEDGVMNNTVNKVVFQRGLKDARTFAQEFGSPVIDDDMKKLGQYEFMARVSTESGISPPFTGKTLPPLEPYGYGKAAKQRSRMAHGKAIADIDAEVLARRLAGAKPTVLKDIGEESYDDED